MSLWEVPVMAKVSITYSVVVIIVEPMFQQLSVLDWNKTRFYLQHKWYYVFVDIFYGTCVHGSISLPSLLRLSEDGAVVCSMEDTIPL